MNLSDIKYINQSTSSLSFGSVLSEEDLQFFTEGVTSTNFQFGQSEKDNLQIDVYNFDDTLVTSSVMYAGGTYTNYTRSYYDATNKFTVYSYKLFTSNWPILTNETSSLFLDVSKTLNGMGVIDGNYKVVIRLIRNMVGSEKSYDDKLIVDTISTTRDEIAIIPRNLKATDSAIANEYSIFASNQVQIKEVVNSIIDAISTPEIYTTYYSVANADAKGAAALKFDYGFTNRGIGTSSDIDVVAFLTDLYYGVRRGNTKNNGQIAVNDIIGIYDQFKNWLYQNYESGVTFQDIRNYYYSLFVFVVDQELNRITNTKPTDYESVINFLQKIYYDSIFYPALSLIEYKYSIDLSGYFKNYINLNSGLSISILNRKIISSVDPAQYDKLVLKLDRPLPLDVSVGDDVWITNDFGFLPVVQNLYYFTAPFIQTYRLRGPNFNLRIESEGNSTEALSMEKLIAQTGSAYQQILTGITLPSEPVVDTTNYRELSSFVNFSSANLRISAFDNKNKQINFLQEEILALSSKLEINPDDTFYKKELDDANSELTSLKNSFDGYERFLYTNPAWYVDHHSSASLYDRNNGNSLINNLPQFMVEDSDQNQDYILFVGMVGHFFDNLSLVINQITEKNNYSNSPNYGISMDIVEDMLASLGWDAEISKDNLPLLLSSFSHKDFPIDSDLYNLSKELSEQERNQIIWKRILNSLPHIYKTKGTEASLSALLSCFGVPKNIVKIKEYGGIRDSHNLQDESLYIIDEVKYEPYFSGSGEYFQTNWTGSAKTFEFNFAFNKNKISEEGNVFRLVNCPDSWAVGVYRDKGKTWGRLFFSLDDGSGSVTTIMTDKAPVFDGSTYHAMVRRNIVAPELGVYGLTDNQIDEYPVKYDVYLQRAEDSRITFFVTASQYLSGSYNANFRNGTDLYIGNYSQNTASLSIDPEAFYGNIDEIKLWEVPLPDSNFTNHTLHQNSYDLSSPKEMIKDNLVRISFERPLNLYSETPLTLNNLSFRGDFPTFFAVNFPETKTEAVRYSECDPSTVSAFPWQFTRKDSRQTIKLPDYGSSKFRSNKINYVEQELVSTLSSTERATIKSSDLVSVDANKIGIFFSPSEIQNTEIIKFFGNYPLNELIGNPNDVYASSYSRFEQFRQVFYDQGFGNIDYQFFMNVVRFYFDKTMFKYIRAVVPARAKLVDGILIEPTILERPKIQLRPLVREVIPQKEGVIQGKPSINPTFIPQLTHTLALKKAGHAIFTDVNQIRFPIEEDVYGFGVFSDDGVTLYNGEYYRTDVIKINKQYQIHNAVNLPKSSLNEYEEQLNYGGTVTTVSRSYYKVNLAKLPTLHEYITTASLVSVYFDGNVTFEPTATPTTGTYVVSSSHVIDGIITGSIIGTSGAGTIFSPGIKVSASYQSNYLVTYTGSFTASGGGSYKFIGNIEGEIPASVINAPLLMQFYTEFYNSPTGSNSIFDDFSILTQGSFFGGIDAGIQYRKEYSLRYYPNNAELLNGYYITHYKYSKQQFSVKEVNSYDQNNNGFKWKRGSQNKKTTVDPATGLLNNSEPVETKTV